MTFVPARLSYAELPCGFPYLGAEYRLLAPWKSVRSAFLAVVESDLVGDRKRSPTADRPHVEH